MAHMFRYSRIIMVAITLALVSGCATSYDKRGLYHRVRSGESIYRVASIYGTDAQSLAEYNNVLNPDGIEPGTRLYIPPHKKRGAFKRLPFGEDVGKGEVISNSNEGVKQHGRKMANGGGEQYTPPIQVYRGRFIWPVGGRVVSPFGYRDGRRHDGVDLSGSDGTPIYAAAAGKVVYAGSMRGYGNLVLIRHKDNIFTTYAHNSSNKVRKGQIVKQGQVIADIGHSGRATGPHLHFEIRDGQTARNPLFFLPARNDSGTAVARRIDRHDDDEVPVVRAQVKRDEVKKKTLASVRKGEKAASSNKKTSIASADKKKGKASVAKSGTKASTTSAKKAVTTSSKGKANGTNVQKAHSRR